MRFRRARQSQESHHIDVTPLIDMVFFLLIFFMVSSSFTKEMKVDLTRPGASSGSAAQSKTVRVYIDNRGEIHVDGQSVRLWSLQGKVRELLAPIGEKSVLIVADKSVPVERLLEVIDQCKFGGAKDVGVAAQQEESRA